MTEAGPFEFLEFFGIAPIYRSDGSQIFPFERLHPQNSEYENKLLVIKQEKRNCQAKTSDPLPSLLRSHLIDRPGAVKSLTIEQLNAVACDVASILFAANLIVPGSADAPLKEPRFYKCPNTSV